MTELAPVVELAGVERPYPWGSPTLIPDLLGVVADGRPVAELWFGAHEDDPSAVPALGASLADVITSDPRGVLGDDVAARFDRRLPFLVKLLAADRPLSIQVHPTLDQARAGFAAEEARGVQRNAPERNYRDRNHKPELLCALTPFDALCGFRPVPEAIALLDELAVPALAEVRALLAGSDGLRAAFTHLLGHPDEAGLAQAVVAAVAQLPPSGTFAAAARAAGLIAAEHPDDVGVVLSLLLNAVTLAPGEAIFLGAGTVHCYLRGLGVEIMANSDNVLRCGLTSKHVDLAEVLQITDFTPLADPRMRVVREGSCLRYPAPVADFALSVLDIDAVDAELDVAGPQIVLCTAGTADLEAAGHSVRLAPGHAAFIRAGSATPMLRGSGQAFVVRPGQEIRADQ